MHRTPQQIFVATMIMFLLLTTSLVQAQETASHQTSREPTAEAMLADAFVVRPFGIAATVLGSVAFVVSLPFTLPTRSVDKAAQKLVVDPAKFTFARPLGQMPREP